MSDSSGVRATPKLGVGAAFAFIELLQHDEELQTMVAGRAGTCELDWLCALAKARGYAFTEQELRQAFAADWQMRRRLGANAPG